MEEELISDLILDEITILTFPHLLEKKELGEQMFLYRQGSTQRAGHDDAAGKGRRCNIDCSAQFHLNESGA